MAGCDPAGMLAELERERRAVRLRVGGEERWIAADDAGLYRDAFGAVPPSGLPEAFTADVDRPLERVMSRYARTHGPFTTARGAGPVRRGSDERAGHARARRRARPRRAAARAGPQREWCDTAVLRRLRRASLAVLRKEIEAADARALATFLPSWQGVDRHPAAGAGIDRLREVLVPLQGLALPAEAWERDVLPRRCGAYSPTWMDQLCAGGEVVWVGAGSLGRSSGRVALYFREDAEALGAPGIRPARAEPPSSPAHDAIRARLAQAPCFFTDLLAERGLAPEELQEALWDLVWAGEVTNDAFAPLRAPRLTLARAQRATLERRGRAGTRFGSRRGGGARAQVQGRWSLTTAIFGSTGAPAGGPDRRRTTAELLLERYGIVTREQVLAEGVPGGFSALYDALGDLETLGVCRRGYFLEGLGGAQFALPGAVERLRAQRDLDEAPPLVLAATDPAQPYGAALPWPKRDGEVKRPSRAAGAHVVLAGAEPVVYVERGGRGLQVLVGRDDPRLVPGAGGARRLRDRPARPAALARARRRRARRRARRGSRCSSTSASAPARGS